MSLFVVCQGNSTIAELLMRSAEKAGVRLDQYTNREGNFVLIYLCKYENLSMLGCSPAALALKYGHFECANQITHCDCDEFFVVPRPLSIYEHPSNTDGNQTLKSKTKRKSNSHQSAERRSSNRPSSLSFGLLKIIFNDGDANYSNRLAGLCQQAKQHPHRQSMKHNKHEAPQTSITTINKLDRTKSILVNGALYSSTEAVVNETHSTKERQKSFDTNGNHNNSNRTSPRAQILLQPNHLNKSNLSELNSSFIQKTTSKTQLSIDDLNLTKGNLLKTNDEENKLKINKATVCTQTSHSALNYSDNNNNSKAKTKLQNTTTSSLNNPTYLHSSLSQASSAKTKPTTAGLSSTKKSSASNDPIDSITNLLPKQNHSFFSSDSSSYSQTIYAGRSVSALLQQPTNSKSNESSCSIREAKGRKCRYNKPEELFGVRPEELFAPEQHQPKIFDPNSSSKLNDSQRLKRSSLQKYIWQQDVDKIIDLYNIHHCSNYRKTAVPPSQATPATQSNGSNETNNESALMNRPRRVSISKNSLVNSKSSLHSKQSVNTSVNMTRRNSIIRPTIKLTNG